MSFHYMMRTYLISEVCCVRSSTPTRPCAEPRLTQEASVQGLSLEELAEPVVKNKSRSGPPLMLHMHL